MSRPSSRSSPFAGTRLEELVQAGRRGAATAKDVVGHLDTYIAATQFGITLASLALGWIGEPALAHLLEPAFAVLVGGVAPAAAHVVSIGVAFAVITGLHIVFGELAPKGLALQRPEATSLWVARPIQAFHAVFKLPITALNAVGNGALKLVGLEAASGREMVHSVAELRLLLTGMQKAGVVDLAEARIAQRAFAFSDLTAGALMTRRTEMQGVPVTATLDELFQRADTTRHSRLPVYDGSLDNVVGILDVRDLFQLHNTPPDAFVLKALIQPPLIVPETQHAADLLEDMRAKRCHFAMVADEYGGTAGIVTLRDLMQALVGRIDDTLKIENSAVPDGQVEADGSVLLDGLMRVEEFEETAGVRLDADTAEGVETLGGLIVALLGRFPRLGDEITLRERRIRVERLDGVRVAVVRLLRLA